MTDYQVHIENCNSIDQAQICIRRGCLNIKFGPNGLGKSSIAKAIVCRARNDDTLKNLVPFKNRSNCDAPEPLVDGIDDLTSALVFDEEFVNQFAFQKDEVLKNSFEIFIKTPEYSTAMQEIEDLLVGIKSAFSDSPEIEQTTKDLKDLRDAFGKSNRDGSIAKSSKVLKAFGGGNKIDNIPDSLTPYELFIKSPNPSKWIGWQMKGNEYLDLGDTCPYCSTSLKEKEQKETVLAVAKEYDAKAVDHLNALKAVIERLGKYFSDNCQENLAKITKAKVGLTAVEMSFLTALKSGIEALIDQLEGLKNISFFTLRDIEKIEETLPSLKIDLGMIDKLDSAQTRAVTDPINTQLDQLIAQIGTLKGKINVHKRRIEKTIEENQISINDFLSSAGYKYSVQIVAEIETYKMKLVHEDLAEFVDSASSHLSYGEKNAFALVLFMHQVTSEDPDLVILDDPISSFDKNKKFAILHELFRGKCSLRDRTTLMLTHDIEPAIDVVKSTAAVFQGAHPSATHLSSRFGVITESEISREDISTFAKICSKICEEDSDTIIKSIYLRRHYEIIDNTGLEYNLLSSLFKKRVLPTVASADGGRDMTVREKQCAEEKIGSKIIGFDYDSLLAQVCDDVAMIDKFNSSDAGYDKLQIFRIIKGKHENNVIAKFVNETYHIENEYVMQLDPREFESVPEYVIIECERLLSE